MVDSAASSVEFLGFLADVSCPATGEIDMARLAAWLGLTRDELEARWLNSECESWACFADDILAVLDVMQDATLDLATTLAWYMHDPIATLGRTADQAVSSGAGASVLTAIRAREGRCGELTSRKHA